MRRRVARIVVLCTIPAGYASAEEPFAAEPPKPEAPEVRVIGSKPDALQRVPGSGTVLGEKDLARAAPTDAAEMLRRVPGVQARQEYGGGGRFDVGIRGLEAGRSRRVLMLEDGVPVSLNPYAEPDMYYAPPIERMRGVEVVKGSGSILFGPQTLGGVINFLTLAPPTKQELVLDAEGGQYGYGRGLVRYGDDLGGARYVVQALYRRGDGFRSEAFESANMLGKLAFDTGPRGEAVVKIGFHDDASDSDDVGLTREMWAMDPRRPTLAPFDHLHLRRYDVSLTHEQRWERTKLRTLVYAYETSRIWRRQDYLRGGRAGDSYDRIVGDTALPNGAIYFQNTDSVLDRTYDVAGIEPRFETRFETGAVGHTLDYGARLLGETAQYQQRSGDNPTSYAGQLDFMERHRTIAVAAYAQDRIAFKDDLLVTPGLRFEHAAFHRITLRQDDGTGKGVDVSLPGDASSNGLIPGIGIVYGTRTAHVFGGLHVGWAPPRLTSAISPKGVPQQLSAEESTNWELGTRVSPLKWARAEGTLFVSKFKNQVVLNTATAASATQEVDAGETRHAGVEAGLTLQIGRALGWPTIVDVGARYTFVRATFVGGSFDGNLLPYAPLHGASANVDVEHETGLGGQVAWTHVGSQFTDIANTVAEDATGRVGKMGAYDIVDATLHYRHKPSGLSARLTVKNALDATYLVARRPEGMFPGGYRQILLGLRWEWERAQESAPR